MAKIYKGTNPLIKKISLVFMVRVLFVIIPAVLLVLLFRFIGDKNVIVSLILAALLIQTVILFYIFSRYYDILLSGNRGERRLRGIIKYLRAREMTVIFTNLPIEYGRKRSELDMLIVGRNGVFIIEAKNHSGVISGNSSNEKWTQTKHHKNGKTSVKVMDNPFRQTGRQREILKSILKKHGLNVWVNEIIFFTNPRAKLSLALGKNKYVYSDEQSLLKHITGNEKILNKEDLDSITRAFIG